MSTEPENPKAFPTGTYNKGMTLRDYFAGQALVSVIRNSKHDDEGYQLPEGHRAAHYAARSYCIADAMLVEREGIPR